MAPWPQNNGAPKPSQPSTTKPAQSDDLRPASIAAGVVFGIYLVIFAILGTCTIVQYIGRRNRKPQPIPEYLRPSNPAYLSRTGNNASFLAQDVHNPRRDGAQDPKKGSEVVTRDLGSGPIGTPPVGPEVYVVSPQRTPGVSAVEAPLIPLKATRHGHPDVLRREESGYSLRDAAGYGDSDSDTDTVTGLERRVSDVSDVTVDSTRRYYYPEAYRGNNQQ
ncbi:hypothetical protein P152DRAFT_453856 [Eremomyces bilateralis CBS 781.70]|uniref:Transmembrane protein n=1 Tax=Eremomyces bilateralis CBS 781.70 TaxID=1392243 RepID=A0A6G1GGS2_9PEZI|nr:uncharacterized protein P152DRAFT_453856 [Eremomyces bilateralis CBS 781.70]KAF1817268.1 hypothetical protein P152DRAFT_453856 [Eremomyces bilateralis CBS 781.70]